MIRLAVILLFVPLLLCSQIATDKKYHAGAGVVIGVWGTFAGNSIELKPEGAALFGIGSVAAAGLGKELWDEIDYGGWDWQDLGYTMVGGVIGTGLTYAGLKIFKHAKPHVAMVQDKITIGIRITI